MTESSVIPENHIAFCKAVAQLCRDHKMERVGLTYTPSFRDPWSDPIQMVWEQGRHGEDSDKLTITSTVQLRAVLNTPAVIIVK